MSIIIHDNTDHVLRELEEAIERSLTRIGLAAEGYAKRELSKPKTHGDGTIRPNVDTGLLRNSITFAINGKPANITSYNADRGYGTGTYHGNAPNDIDKAVYVGTNVEYAAYVEMGTASSKSYPYLKPAATEHSTTYKRIIEDELKNG